MNMTLFSTPVSAICVHVQQDDREEDPAGFTKLKSNVDLLKIVDIQPNNPDFSKGDIVISKATGRDVEADGTIYNIQSLENLIAKVK